jgi:hypothetical protein
MEPSSSEKAPAMTYIESILEPGEKIRYHTTVSWTVYTPALLLALCALASAVAAAGYSHVTVVGWFIAALFAIAAAVTFIPAWFRRWTTEIAVTDRRVILKRESVDVDQTLMGRLFDYGNVSIRGTGSSFETLRMIDSPLKLRTTVTAG